MNRSIQPHFLLQVDNLKNTLLEKEKLVSNLMVKNEELLKEMKTQVYNTHIFIYNNFVLNKTDFYFIF